MPLSNPLCHVQIAKRVALSPTQMARAMTGQAWNVSGIGAK